MDSKKSENILRITLIMHKLALWK